MAKRTVKSEALGIFIGSRLIPSKDGKKQKKVSPEQALKIANRRNSN